MASGKLPRELEEEILSRLPPRSLIRFRSVCKHWKHLFNDKRFINNSLARARPQFIILTKSKIYSIDTIALGGVDPTIEVNELASELHFEAKKSTYTRITACDGLLFRHFWMQGVTIWNPCLRQVGLIEYEDRDFHLLGVGYDTTKPEKGYKILGYFDRLRRVTDACQEGHLRFAIYECASHSFKFIDSLDWPMVASLGEYVSLNGNLHWASYNKETREYFLGSFDFSTEISMRFCLPPYGKHVSGSLHKLVLTVFKGDRFALLKQSRISRNTEVWVTKEKINNSNKDDVVWLNLMTLSIPNFPSLFNQFSGIRYFIYDKTLIMCCGADQTGVACIFIARGDMCKKIQIGSGFDHFSHCVYLPNLISVPSEFKSVQKKIGGFSSVDGIGEGEDEEQLSSVVLYDDINGYLFSLRSNEARLSLVYQFIDFFGAHISPWTSSNSLSWSEKISSLETLSDSMLENLRSVHECLSKSDSANCFSLVSLLGGSYDISMRTEMMKFLRNAILLCLNVFPRNYILEEAVLVAEELYVTNMKTCEVATTPCQALAKRLLKSDRQDLLLCGVYAQREAASGNMKHARRVFDMALTSICGLSKELQCNAPLLCLWYAESEVANSSGSGRDTESSSRAIHILCYLGSGLAYIPYTSQSSSMQILRARQGFREKLKKIQSTWSHGVTDDQSAALVCSAALFEELTNDLPGAVEILEHMFSSVLPGRKSQSHQLELLFNYYVRMLQRHQDDLTLSQLWKPISEGLQLYPLNPVLYRALVDICNHRMTSHRLRMMFDDYSRKNSSVVVWLFALCYELSKGGSLHRIRGLFERALAQDTQNNSVILWRCYIAYEIDIAHNPSAARRIYFRAINACPWSKKLWLDGYGKLSSVLTAKELSDLQEVMRDKELNIRTDIYEILLMQG